MRHSTGALAFGHLHECEPCVPAPANLIYRAYMAHGAGESGVRYCTLHTARCRERSVPGLGRDRVNEGEGVEVAFCETRSARRTLGPSDYRLQRSEGKGQRAQGMRAAAPHRDRPVPFQVPHPRASHQRGTCKYMHAVSWNSEATVDHQDSATTGKQVVGLVGRQRGQIQTRKRRDDGVQEEDGRTAEGDRQDQNREGRIWGV